MRKKNIRFSGTLRVCPREDQADGGTVEITDFAHISPIVALW